MRVFVLDPNDSPLTPCHPARARMLLARGRAEVVAQTPFTIRLKEARPDVVVVPVTMGIDDGAREVGFSVVMNQKQGVVVVSKGVIQFRQDIKEIMQERRNHRRQRRKRLGYRQARFNNRKRQEARLLRESSTSRASPKITAISARRCSTGIGIPASTAGNATGDLRFIIAARGPREGPTSRRT